MAGEGGQELKTNVSNTEFEDNPTWDIYSKLILKFRQSRYISMDSQHLPPIIDRKQKHIGQEKQIFQA